MARIRHIALVTDDPAKTAEFYKTQFGLTELYRRPSNTGEHGVWLSDGYIYFAILKYGEPGAPKLGLGQKSDLRGLHHIGFYVDDEQAKAKELEAANFGPIPMGYDEGGRPMREPGEGPGGVNLKYYGPDAVQIDIRSSGWNEVIGLGMQRLELTPVKEEEPVG
jgi:catechol 2,3-dioxygenase-like lactoylglutathione lyase family enzyme